MRSATISEIAVKGEPAGVVIRCTGRQHLAGERQRLEARLATLDGGIEWRLDEEWQDGAASLRCRLSRASAEASAPDSDTSRICDLHGLDTVASGDDLEREILIAMLSGPVAFEHPSVAELDAAIHVRRNIVRAARRTALDFNTTTAERPTDYWRYDDDYGFVVLPGCSLIEALRKATQPELSGTLYSFSCYRATEYVILLAIAEELAESNPDLLLRLQCLCEHRMIRSGQFHDVFLREYGSQDIPLPPRYYVPGDRLWFRNPDERSSDVVGFEGSWVFYLGNGLFSNFWKPRQTYSLNSKCLEIFHWRHGAYLNEAGELCMDESVVDACVAQTLAQPDQLNDIIAEMMRWREPKGCYGHGGCIDTTREYPRWLCPGSSDLELPAT